MSPGVVGADVALGSPLCNARHGSCDGGLTGIQDLRHNCCRTGVLRSVGVRRWSASDGARRMGMSPFLGEGLAGRWRAKNCQRQRPRTSANGAKKVTKKRCAKGGPAPRAVCLALRAQSHRWDYCVERLPSLLQHTEGRPQLRVAPQGRLITGTTSERPHREDGEDVCTCCPILRSTPRSPTVRSYSAAGADLKNQAPAQAGA